MNPAGNKQIFKIIDFARKYSPFYSELYSDLPENISSLQDIPLVEKTNFWEANTFENNRVLTGPISDGIVFKSGGTTSAPKFSVYSNDDWMNFTKAFGLGIKKGGIRAGEKIGITGDTGYCTALEELLRQSDRAVMEWGLPDLESRYEKHISSDDILTLIKNDALPGKVYINHMYLKPGLSFGGHVDKLRTMLGEHAARFFFPVDREIVTLL